MFCKKRTTELLSQFFCGVIFSIALTGCSTINFDNNTNVNHNNTDINTVEITNKNLISTINSGFFLQKSQADFANLLNNSEIADRLLSQYDDWKSVAYRWGGESKKGVDCSAFVQITYREQFGVELPRTTFLQKGSGEAVKKNQLQIGDLVIFDTGLRTRHIGIYLGNNQFVHAATSLGVSISQLDNSYWDRHFTEGRRVLKKDYSLIEPELETRNN